MEKSLGRTLDGYICHANGIMETGLITMTTNNKESIVHNQEYDVIIIGAGFAGLIAARELSLRSRSVLIIEARDRIGGRTFTAQVESKPYEIGGTWVHWSQPHIWAEMTRYGFSLIESEGAVADHVSVLLDHGSRLRSISTANLYFELFSLMDKFSDVDGQSGRTLFPLPHAPLTALEALQSYDHLTMQERLEQISSSFAGNDDIRQILDAYLSMNTQGDLKNSGFLDHLCFWALGDYDTIRTWDKTSRYKIREGTSLLAQAILDDCQNTSLLLSTPVVTINRLEDRRVAVHTKNQQIFYARATIITVPLNALHNIEFRPALEPEKHRAIAEGQCCGGTKFWVKLEKPIGKWCGFAPYPNPITVAYTDDPEGNIIVGFGPDNALDIRKIEVVESELQKFLPSCKIKHVFGHDWRDDPYVQSTWSWYKPGQVLSNLRVLQNAKPPLFFASSDIANSWRGCIDGAIESGLTSARQIQQYL